MATLGARLGRLAAGEAEIELPFSQDLVQQHGYLHAGAITTIADSACGYAALSLIGGEFEVLAVEFKINFLAPAKGDLIAKAKVLRSGKRITACSCEVVDKEKGDRVAFMLGSIINVKRN
ncbi:MAG: PaaI family thioesterase [Planctomycetota bacterium]|jgi:uncharacterized protein (TIGR00369 family)